MLDLAEANVHRGWGRGQGTKISNAGTGAGVRSEKNSNLGPDRGYGDRNYRKPRTGAGTGAGARVSDFFRFPNEKTVLNSSSAKLTVSDRFYLIQ